MLSYRYFLFYKHLREGGITKYRENHPTGSQSPNFCIFHDFGQNLKFLTAIKLKKKKFIKLLHIVFVSPWNHPIWTNLAKSDLKFGQFMLKKAIFLRRVIFPIFCKTIFTKFENFTFFHFWPFLHQNWSKFWKLKVLETWNEINIGNLVGL